ncbi:hypothetical protein BX070DRAFT_221036 [Coemansia spiralis]|nr:hypothetical protein BX070DRAFT_221036 [Coemansia spiralis]
MCTHPVILIIPIFKIMHANYSSKKQMYVSVVAKSKFSFQKQTLFPIVSSPPHLFSLCVYFHHQ